MNKCAIVACDHGFGHARRSMLIANRLARSGIGVELFADGGAAGKFKKLFGVAGGVKIREFSTGTDAASFKNGIPGRWHERLPDTGGFDLVVSDNLPEILYLRDDAVLSGSFLWHRSLDEVSAGYFNEIEALLEETKPAMISSGLFSPDYLSGLTNLKTVGLFVPDVENRVVADGSDILVACGNSGENAGEFKRFVNELACSGKSPGIGTVWVDPLIMPESPPDWMRAASYRGSMFKKLKAAVCRPGVGTLTECLWHGIRPFCNFEPGNQEMLHNAGKMAETGAGEYYPDIGKCYESLLEYFENSGSRRQHLLNVQKIDFNGAAGAVSEIAAIMEERGLRIPAEARFAGSSRAGTVFSEDSGRDG